MTTKLHISPTLSLPLDFVTSTQAILAKKGIRERVLAALQWFDAIGTEDLFDAMEIGDAGERNTYTQALHRLWKAGEVERVGERKPFRYRSKA